MKNNTLRALLASLVSLLLCVSMLVGSTFAWFTDKEVTGVNTIVSGNLDIKLSYKNAADSDYKGVSAQTTDLFVDANEQAILWEPGVVSVCYFKLENLGSLALQYKMNVSYKDTVTYTNDQNVEVKLSDALKSAIVDLDEGETLTRSEAMAAAEAGAKVALGHKDTQGIYMENGTTKYFAMVIYMPTSVDNTYNLPTGERALEIQLGIDLVATQAVKEDDSFDNTYDQYPEYPEFPDRIYAASVQPYQNTNPITDKNTIEGWAYTIPAGAIVPNPENLEAKSVTVKIINTSGTTFNFSVVDDKNLPMTLSKPASISLDMRAGVENVKINGSSEGVNYDERGEVTFSAAVAGDYTITYDIPGAVNVSNAEEFVNATADANFADGSITLFLTDDIDMNNVAWAGMDMGPAGRVLTIYGNGHTIFGLTNNGTAGASGNGGIVNDIMFGNTIVIENLILDGLTVNTSKDYVGGIVGYVGETKEITLTNVTIKNANISGGSDAKVGGFIGYNTGYSDEADGAVYARFNVVDCALINSTVSGTGSTGGVIGQAGADQYSKNVITNFTATGNTVTGENTQKTGLLIGSANQGMVEITVDATKLTGNKLGVTSTPDSASDNNTLLVGRLALETSNTTGYLTINGTKYSKANVSDELSYGYNVQ